MPVRPFIGSWPTAIETSPRTWNLLAKIDRFSRRSNDACPSASSSAHAHLPGLESQKPGSSRAPWARSRHGSSAYNQRHVVTPVSKSAIRVLQADHGDDSSERWRDVEWAKNKGLGRRDTGDVMRRLDGRLDREAGSGRLKNWHLEASTGHPANSLSTVDMGGLKAG